MAKRDSQHPRRNFQGYGAEPPQAQWPHQARIAVQFVINYEEGGEYCLTNGDRHSEAFLSEIIGAERWADMRHMNIESLYEYGSRAGFYRLHRIFSQRQVPATVFAVARALELNPDVVQPMQDAGWEIASHGLRWIDYHALPLEEERRHLLEAIRLHTEITGERPLGFYTGRSSVHSRQLVAEEGGFVYNADSYADDLPYWDHDYKNPLLIVPYTLDTNDMRFATAQGFNCGDQFYSYLKDSFDFLYQEGASHPKMLSVGLHCRLAGRPGRAMAVAKFLDYVLQHEKVWCPRRIDIARHWQQQYPHSS